jgi:endogenous inhibitor of DNA gyrase (YacG/DUF329 family)
LAHVQPWTFLAWSDTVDFMEEFESDQPNYCLAPGCKKKGYFKYELCRKHRPICNLCGKSIFAPRGVIQHPFCVDRAKRIEVGELNVHRLKKQPDDALSV